MNHKITHNKEDFPGGSDRKESACSVGDLGREDPLDKVMSTHSSILIWRIPWTEEPGGLYMVQGGCKELHTTERPTLSLFTFTGKRVWFPTVLVPFFILWPQTRWSGR